MNNLNNGPVTYRNQAGVTLVVSLVILVALTLLGVTSMQSTRTEISMAGNLRELGITFNAAEAGLSDAEFFVDNSTSKGIYADTSIGLYSPTDDDPEYGDPATWLASQISSTYLADVAEQPRFVIKYLGDRSQNEVAAVNIGGYGSAQPGITVSNFRVTAKGTGLSGNAHRYLQSYFGKEF